MANPRSAVPESVTSDLAYRRISALIHRYAECIDDGDLEAVSRLFEDATYRGDGGGVYRGAAAVLDVLRRMVVLYDGVPRTKHVTTNIVIDVDETAGTARAQSYYTVFQATENLPLQPIVAGRYHDTFACVDGAWRFTDRLIFIDLRGNLSQHLRRRP